MSSRLLTFFAFLFLANTAFAQQVYPVSLTGLLIPPHSLDLSVYGTQRAQDLVFTAALLDPVEPYRDTRLKLYLENNGKTLYTTDPNYGLQPIRLNMNQPVLLDGFALQPYLQPEALIGAAGQGQGSVIMPEGLNRICVEVIDLERNVPISRKTCVTGGFFLNEPPMLQLPACGSNVLQAPMQSQTFTWTPLHLGSGNNPAPVEYLFQLVELQPGVDPNDGFDFSLKILERTTLSPSLIYGPADPILMPGHSYAWRVQARNMLKPGLMFRNGGFSAICSFVYGDGFPPFISSQAAEDMEEARVCPQGCEVFNTDFGPIFTQDYTTAVVEVGDTIKVGWFDMIVKKAVQSGGGYSGYGHVKIPMLNALVQVHFRDLKVKANTNRCYEAASLGAESQSAMYHDFKQGWYQPDYYFQNLHSEFENGPFRNNLTDQLDPNSSYVNLPVGIKSDQGPYMVTVNELHFTPRNAFMNCTAWQVNDDGTLNSFGPLEIPITPYGIRSGARLPVAQSGRVGGVYAGIFYTGAGGESDKTGMNIDCAGFKSLLLDNEITVDSTLMKSATGGPVRFRLASSKSDPYDYLGGIKKFDAFALPKMPGYQFSMKNGTLDLSEWQKNGQNKLASFHPQTDREDWQGLYLGEVSVAFPPGFNLLGDAKPVQLDRGSFALDATGGQGHFFKTNLLTLDKGRMGTWPYSVDSLQLRIAEGEAERTWLSGQLKVPVLDEPFDYSAELSNFGQENLNISLVQGQRTMSLWSGKMQVSADSKVRAVLKDFGPAGKQFMPSADLGGVFSMEIGFKQFDDLLVGNKAIIKQRLKQIFSFTSGSPDFSLQNLRIESLKIDPFQLPSERYLLSSYTPDPLGLSIGKMPAQVGQIRLVYRENDGNGQEELGFQVVVKKGQNLVQFTFFAKAKPNGDGFIIDRIEVETEEVDCDCHAFVPFEEMLPDDVDRMLRRTYRRFYAPAVGGNLTENSSGLAGIHDFAQQNTQLLDAFENATVEHLRNHLLNGFPLLDDVLNLTFLDVQLDMEGTKAKVAIERSSPDFTFKKIDELPADGPRQLPLYLTPDLLTKMGITDNQLPKNSRLLITAFEAAGTPYNEQNTSVEFTLLAQVNDSTYAQFVRPNVKVSPTSVDFKDFYLFLADDVAISDPLFNDGEGNPAVFFKKTEPKEGTPNAHTDSYAHLICDGFQKYVVQGEYAVPFNSEGEDEDFPEAQLKYRDNEKEEPAEAESQLQLAFRFIHDFTLDKDLELGDFIAAVKSETADGKPLQFASEGQEGLIFQEGEAMEVYFDFDQDFNVDSMPAQAGYDFKGLYFKKITAELEGFAANDTANVKVDVIDLFFKPDEDFYYHGMGGTFELYDILPFDKGIKMGGWQYSLDTLVLDYLSASQDEELQPCLIAGMLRCPVFKYDSEEDLLAYTGQLAFMRERDEENGEIVYHPGAVFTVGEEFEEEDGEDHENEGSLAGMAFRAEFIPGLTLALDEGSTIGFDWTEMPDGREGFLPSVDLTGTASLFFSKKATEIAAEAVEVAQNLGIDFSLPGATFEGFKINKEPNADEPGTVTVGNKLGGVQSVNMGTWGYSLGFPDEAFEGEDEEKEETKKEEPKKPAPKSKNKKSKGIAKGKGKSAGNKPAKATASTNKKTETKKPGSKKDEEPKKAGMNGFPISIDVPEFEYNELTKKWAMNLAISINLLPEKGQDEDKKAGAKPSTGKKITKAPTPAKGKTSKAPRTAGIAATTTLSFFAKPDVERGIVYDGVGLKTIHVLGQFASAEIEGGLHFIKPQTEEDLADWGEGFKAYGSIKIGKTSDGDYRLRGKAMFQFGTVARDTAGGRTGDYRYFFADLEALYSTNIQPHKGLPLVKAVPPAPPLDIINLHGGGGGIYYNMEKDPAIPDDEEEAEPEDPEEAEEKAIEEEKKAEEEEKTAKLEEQEADKVLNDAKKSEAEKAAAKKKKADAQARQSDATDKKTKAKTKKESAQKKKAATLAAAKPGAKKRSNNLKGKKKAAAGQQTTATAAASPKKKKAKKVKAPAKEENKKEEDEKVDENAEYEVPDEEWMEPGASLSGFTYTPKEKSYGGYIKGIFSVVQPKLVSLDAAIGIEVGKNEADKFVFKKIFAKADGYMMAESLDDRADAPIYATAQLELDFANELLAGSFSIEADYAIEPILSVKIDGKKTRGAMLVEFKEGGQFYIKAGRPLERMGADLEAFGSKMSIQTYFQLGQDLDPMPQVAEIVPGWPVPAEKIKEREINPSTGIALGMSLHVEKNYDFAIFYAGFNGGLGFDVAMGRSELRCPDGYQVGMDGWMLKGQIFAYAGVDVGLRYKLGAMKGKVSVLRANIGATLRGQFPNPSVFTGQLAGNYAVLGGLIEGSFNLKFQIASDKDKECLKGLLSNPNPLAEFPLVADKYPNEEKNTDIPIFAQPKLAYNMSVGYEVKVDDVDSEGNDVVRYYKASLDPSEGFILKKKLTGVKIPCQPVFEAKSTTLKPLQMLEPKTEYVISWKLKWQQKLNGSWVDIKNDNDSLMVERGSVTFTTGNLPGVIVSEFLDYHAPGRNQRYWHKGYADTRIKFDKAAPPGTDWQQQYFPKNKYVQGFGNVNYDYVVRLTRYANGQQDGVFDVPLSEYPGMKNFQVPVTTYVQVGSMFVIPRVEVQNAQGLNVGFAGLDNLITNDPQWTGKLYKIQLMRLPLLPKTAVQEETTTTASTGAPAGNPTAGLIMTDVDTETTSKTAEASTVSIPKTSLVSNESKLPAEDGLKILYEYWFATSKYDNLNDKLAASQVQAVRSHVQRTDYNHPNDKTELNFSFNNSDADFPGFTDDYFTFNNAKEGFDQFDLDRIRLNAVVTYPDNYTLRNKLWNDANGVKRFDAFTNVAFAGTINYDYNHYRFHINFTCETGNSQLTSYKNLLTSNVQTNLENLKTYWKARMVNPDDDRKWLGNFMLPKADNINLTDKEISALALSTYAPYNGQKVAEGWDGNVFQTAKTYGLVYQDQRSRITGLQYVTMRAVIDKAYATAVLSTLIEHPDKEARKKISERFGHNNEWNDWFWGFQSKELKGGHYVSEGTNIGVGTVYSDKWHDSGPVKRDPEGRHDAGSRQYVYSSTPTTEDFKDLKNWYLGLKDIYKNPSATAYTGRLVINIPKLNKWQDMGQTVASTFNMYSRYEVTVYPDRDGVDSSKVATIATRTAPENAAFKFSRMGPDIFLDEFPRDAEITSIEIQLDKSGNGTFQRAAFWDAKARELDLYNNATGTKRAIKYNVTLPGADGSINLSNLFQIAVGDGNTNATWSKFSVYADQRLRVLVKTSTDSYTFEKSPSNTKVELVNLNKLNPSLRRKALHFSRGAGATANMLTMKMIGAEGGWDFGACLVVDKETNQAVAHLDASRKLTKYSYSPTGYVTQTSTYTEGEPMVELDPTHNYTLYVAKSGQSVYSASLLLDKEAFWQDKVGQFFEENTFSNAASLGTVEAPKPVGFSTDSAKDGKPIAVPGRWQATDFARPNMTALAGKGMAYHKPGYTSSTLNRSTLVQNMGTGDWLVYVINVPKDGKYLLKMRATARGSKRQFNLELDGNRLNIEPFVMNSALAWPEKRFDLPLELPAGEHQLKIAFADDGFDLEYFELIAYTPTLEVSGKSRPIAGGGTLVKPEDGTDFGLRPCADGEPEVFTIKNRGVGMLRLTGNPLVALSGSNAEDFKVVKMPATIELNEGDSTSFSIQFYPNQNNTGSRAATVTVRSNGQGSDFTFPIRANNSPVLAEIKSGDKLLESTTNLPGTDDPRHFGKIYGNAPVTRQFVFNNRGNAPLTLSNTMTGSNLDFTVSDFPTVVPANGSKAFNVTFTPKDNQTGVVQAQLKITSTGCDQNPVIMPLVAVVPGMALNFDGQNDCVELPVPDLGSGNAITIEYWFKGTNPTSAVRLQNGDGFIVAGWQGKHIISTDSGVNGISMGNAADGRWHHIAMTWERNKTNGFRSYLDGKLVEQRNSKGVALPVIRQGAFLGSKGGSSEFLKGSLDEVRIWNRSLSQYEIQQRMNCELQGNEPGLVLYFDFNQGIAAADNQKEDFVKNKADESQATLRNFALAGNASNWVKSGSSLTQNTVCSVQLPYLALSDKSGNEIWNSTSIDFGDLKPGETKALTLTIANPGTGTLNFTGTPKIAIDGADAMQFAVSPDFSTASIPAGGEAKFTVRFAPAGQGGSKNATLTISSNSSGGSDFAVNLDGSFSAAIMAMTGNGAEITDGSNSASATNHTAFGDNGVGSTAERIFTINNSGQGLLKLTGFSVSGDAKDDFKIIPPAKTSLAANESVTFSVRFSPTQLGQRNANVAITSNLTGDAALWTFAVDGKGIETANVLAFDGRDDYLEVPGGIYFEGDFTVEAWVYASGNSNTYFFSNLLEFSDAGGQNRVKISLQPSVSLEVVQDGISSWLNGEGITGNGWTHVAVALLGNQASIYLNGKQVASGQVQAPKAVTLSNNQIGRAQNVGTLYLDEFRIWNRWLSEEDIAARMNCELGGQENNLVLYYDFNQGTPGQNNALVNFAQNKKKDAADKGMLKNFALTGGASNWATISSQLKTQNCFYTPKSFVVAKAGNSNKLKTGLNLHDFDLVAKGQEESQQFEFFNLENAPVTVNLSLTGEAASAFSVTPNQLTLPANGKSTATVYFKPTASSTTALVVSLNAGVGQDNQWTGNLIGYAVEAGATALFFDGIDDKVQIPAGNYFTGDFTIETWVNRIYTPSGATLLDCSDGAGNRIELAFPSLKITMNKVVKNAALGELPDYKWKHVAVSLRGKTGSIFVDGELAQTFELDAPLTSMGWTNCTLGNKSMMKLDELRIWNRSLNKQEIKAKMNCELTGSEDGLTLYYKFNQGIPNDNNTARTIARNSSPSRSAANGQLVNFGLKNYRDGNPVAEGKSNWVAGESPVSGTCAPFVALPEIALQGGNPLAVISKGSKDPTNENGTDFENQGLGTETERLFELTNTGTATLNISGITAGNGFTIENLEKTTLAPYEKTTFGLVFKPTALGRNTATVTVSSNLPEPWKFDVAGSGIEAASNLNFDGVNDEISVGLAGVDFENWKTIEFWAKVADKEARPVLWKNFVVAFTNGTLTYNGVTLVSGLASNNWYHFALVRNAATNKVTCFLNGKQVSEKEVPAKLNDSYTPETLEIGQYMSGTHFKGNLDELRVWSTSLTASDVLQRMYCELKGREPGLLLYYKFNQGEPGGNNNSNQVYHLASANASKPNGQLKNFGLNGSESNWVSGSPVAFGAKCDNMSAIVEIDVLRGFNALENNAPSGSDTDFGSVSPGDSKSLTFTLANKGGASLLLNGSPKIAVGGANAGQFSVSPDFTAGSLGAFDETDFTVKFTPDGSCETCTATLTIVSNDSDEGNFVVNLKAKAQSGSQIVVRDVIGNDVANNTATPTDLGTVRFGDYKDYTFTIANSGNQELTIGEIKIEPPYLGYSILSKPDKVAPKGSANLVFRFHPWYNPYNPLTAHSLALQIASNDPDENTFLFNLKATATQGGAEMDVMPVDWSGSPSYKDLMASGSTFDFGKSNVGSQVEKQFFILNSGSGGNISLTGTPAVKLTGSSDFTVSVQPALTSIPAATAANANGNQTKFTIVFTPSGEVGERTAQLSIPNSDSDEGNFVVNLKGQVLEEGGEFDMVLNEERKNRVTEQEHTGLEYKPNLSESISINRTLDFGEGKVGIQTTKTFKISNTGSKLLKFTGTPKFALTGPDASQFSLENVSATTSLNPQASEWLTIVFKPSGTGGEKNATLTILNNDADEGIFTIQLRGKMLDSTTEIDFKKYGTNISLASGAPAAPDTDFGEVVTGNSGYLGFQITNEQGRDPIIFTGNPKVMVTGAHAEQFTANISTYNAETTLNVNFIPTGTDGERTATLTILNNDPDESDYVIHVKGRAKYAAPEIEINSGFANSWTHDPLQSGATIDFGALFDGNTKVRNFNVVNTGAGGLVLSGQPKIVVSGEHADQFEVTSNGNNYNYIMENPNSNYIVTNGSVGKFAIRFKPAGPSGERKAVITIVNNDPDEGIFIINLKGRMN